MRFNRAKGVAPRDVPTPAETVSQLKGYTVAMRKSLVPEKVEAYIDQYLVRPKTSPLEMQLIADTLPLEQAGMCSSPEVGGVLYLLAKLIGAKRILEIGVFTGYTALKLAQALPEDGKLIACDISEEWTSIGHKYWSEAGLASRVDLRLAPALQTLATLEKQSFDMAFIDADKVNYPAYYAACIQLVRPGGLIVLDNMLWNGDVAEAEPDDEDARVLKELGLRIANDSRVESAMLTTADGLMLARVL